MSQVAVVGHPKRRGLPSLAPSTEISHLPQTVDEGVGERLGVGAWPGSK